MGNEVEVKFNIVNARKLRSTLKNAGFKETTPSTHEVNVLYDLRGQKLRKRGELLRLRKYGKEWLLTHKAKDKTGRHKSRVERETPIGNGGQMESILKALGYAAAFRYEKFRAMWSDGTGHVVID